MQKIYRESDKKTNLHIILGLACDTMRSSTTKKSCQSTVEESSKKIGDLAGLDDAGLHSVKVSLRLKSSLNTFFACLTGCKLSSIS